MELLPEMGVPTRSEPDTRRGRNSGSPWYVKRTGVFSRELRYVPWGLGGYVNMRTGVRFLPEGYWRPEAAGVCVGRKGRKG